MVKDAETQIRLASAADAPAFGRLLHAFNVEFGEPTPGANVLAERAAPLIESGEVTVLFGGDRPDGFAELRFRPSLYTGALDAYLEELYVVPERRGHGLGWALLEAAMNMQESAAPRTSTSARARTTSPPGRCMRAPGSSTRGRLRRAVHCSSTSATSRGRRCSSRCRRVCRSTLHCRGSAYWASNASSASSPVGGVNRVGAPAATRAATVPA